MMRLSAIKFGRRLAVVSMTILAVLGLSRPLFAATELTIYTALEAEDLQK